MTDHTLTGLAAARIVDRYRLTHWANQRVDVPGITRAITGTPEQAALQALDTWCASNDTAPAAHQVTVQLDRIAHPTNVAAIIATTRANIPRRPNTRRTNRKAS